jgi:type I restriction enzyme S subunit
VREENVGSRSLPKGWALTKLRELSVLVTKGSTPTSYGFSYVPEGINFVKVENIANGRIERHTIKEFITKDAHDFLKRSQLDEDDVLFSIAGTIGRIGIVHKEDLPANINQAVAVIRCPWKFVNPRYLRLFLETSSKQSGLIKRQRGVGMNNVGLEDVKEIKIPFPPFTEQGRIVAKLEELFTRLDAGVDGLRRVKAHLRRYRQAVMKYAFEGKLTEEWRKAHKDHLEPATKLLERIREVRKGTTFKGLQPVNTIDLPTLPEEWTWARIGEIAESMRNGVYRPKDFYGNNGVACLRMYNIENGAIVWKYIKRMNLRPEEIEFYELQPGDILVNRVNSRELVGKAAAIPSGLERCVYESKNIRLRLLNDYADSRYVNFWFLMYSKKFFSRNAQQTVGMASINQEQLASMPIPFCHPNEQTKAVEEIERLFSMADGVEKIATESIEQADGMRQSILKMAFEGTLIPQDPSDEPAERLLERIKAEKAKLRGQKDINKKRSQPKQLELSTYVK